MKIKIRRGKSDHGFSYYATIKVVGGVNFRPFILPRNKKEFDLDLTDDITQFIPITHIERLYDDEYIFCDEIIIVGKSITDVQNMVDVIINRIELNYKDFVDKINFREKCKTLWESKEDEVIELLI